MLCVVFVSTSLEEGVVTSNINEKWSNRAIPPDPSANWGYRENTPAERARTCHELPQVPLGRAGETSAAHSARCVVFTYKRVNVPGIHLLWSVL